MGTRCGAVSGRGGGRFSELSGTADTDGALLLRVRDRTTAIARLQQALDGQAARLRTTVQTETYDGVEIRFLRVAGKEERAVALVGDYIVLAERRGSIMKCHRCL